VILVCYLNQSSILSIIQSKLKKFLDRRHYLLLLIPLLFIVNHSINGLSVPPADNSQSVLNLDFEGGRNQSILGLDFEGGRNQSILGLDFEGGRNQSILGLDFERQNVMISPMASSHFHSVIDNESSSLLTTRPISGNNSLRVDVKPSNDTTKWNTISTDFIPVNENAHNNFSLYLSAQDVNQLHSKILYFDSNKKEIKSAFIFSGRNGTFEEPYNLVDTSPNGTKYMKLQVWVRSNPLKSSNYLIDNIMIKDVVNTQSSNNQVNNNQPSNINSNNAIDYNDLKDLVDRIKNHIVDSDDINLNAFQNSGAYKRADEARQKCIDLAGKIGGKLGDQEIVHCSEDPNFYQNQISNINNKANNDNTNND
jgi:hypothetical protein